MQSHLYSTSVSDLDTLVVLLAGGQGSRLFELTQQRAKPGLEFGGHFRIIDFSLSNCVNSGLKQIGVLTQYKSRHLLHHIINSWTGFHQGFGEFLDVLPASQQLSEQWYQGTADALYQNAEFIQDVGAKHTLVLSGDHVYKMDYRPFIEDHQKSGADMSIACIEMPISEASGTFGVMQVDKQDRILAFQEKPYAPAPLPNKPDHCLASMGVYLFNTSFLLKTLRQDANNTLSDHDFGKNIIPELLKNHHVQAYRFTDGQSTSRPFWRDVGTLNSYWAANMALLNDPIPMQLWDPQWPIWSQQTCLPPIRFDGQDQFTGSQVNNSLIAAGSRIQGSFVHHSVVSCGAQIAANASVCDSVLLPNVSVGKGAIVHKAIVDRDCIIPEGMELGVDAEFDRLRGFRLTESGVVLVSQQMLNKLQTESGAEAKSLHANIAPRPKVQQEMFSLATGNPDSDLHNVLRQLYQ